MLSRLMLLCLIAVVGLTVSSGCGGTKENKLIMSDDELDLEREEAFADDVDEG